MSSEALSVSKPLPEQHASPLWPRVRLVTAWVITMAVLIYAWARTLAVTMLAGRPEWAYAAVFVAGVVAVWVLTFRLSTAFPKRTIGWTLFLAVAIPWLAFNVLLVAMLNGEFLATLVVEAFFVPATLWVPWVAWMFVGPLSPRIRLSVSVLLWLVALLCTLCLRIEGLTGDSRPNFTLAWSKPHRLFAPSEKLDQGPAFPVDLTRTTDHDFPQFLGPKRSGVIDGTKLAKDWKTKPPRLLWKHDIGAGWSGFAVVGEFAITQEQRGPLEYVVCYRISDGATAWVHADKAEFISAFGGVGPRATPTVHAGRVYTIGATGILNCLEGSTGKVVWKVDILADNSAENISHGVCSSPLIVDNRVVVSPTGSNGVSLAAYDCDTGKRVWQGGESQASYGSPLLAELGGVRQILLLNADGIAGHDAATGKTLWKFPWTNSERTNCSQPLANVDGPGRVFVGTGYGIGCVMLQLDGPDKPPTEVWHSRSMKTKFTSPIYLDGYIYGLDDGILESLDAKTGEKRKKAGRYGHGQIIRAGDVFLVQAEDGEVVLVEATPQLKELGRAAAVSGKTWNNLALAGKYLLVRNDHEAACLELALERD